MAPGNEKTEPGGERFEAGADDAGRRLDQFLATRLGVSRKQAAALVARGRVTVAGRHPRKGDRLLPSDCVEVVPDPESQAPVPDGSVPVAIAFEDEHLIVLDKPPGVHCAPLAPGESGTVANYLSHRCPEAAGVGRKAWDHGLVNRIDSGTSGLVVAAKSADAFGELVRGFAERAVNKVYLALISGAAPRRGEIRDPIEQRGRRSRRVHVVVPGTRSRGRPGQEAVTRYSLREALGFFSLVEVRLITGVRHQIRAHLASVGHPILGDPLYGDPATASLYADRPLLHAARIEFTHPVTGKRVRVTAPPPADFNEVLDDLREELP